MGKRSKENKTTVSIQSDVTETPIGVVPDEKPENVKPIVPVKEKPVVKVPIKRNRKPRLLVAEPRNPNFI